MIVNLKRYKPFRPIIKWIASVLILVLLGLQSYGQSPEVNFQTIDKSTYLLYTQQNWDSLIQLGNQALKSGVDYYYLRLRLGIAYSNKGNYLKATQNLEKAIKFNNSDAAAKEYLYYSYYYSNRKKEARTLSSHFTTSLKNKLQVGKVKFLEKLYIETGPTFSNNIKQNQIQRPRFNNNTSIEQDLNDDKYYLHAGFEVNLSKRISAYLGYSFLTISKLKQILFPGMFPPGNQNIGPFYNDEYKLFQNQFYGNLKFYLGSGFSLSPAYHFINVKYSTIYPDFQPDFVLYDHVIYLDTSFNNHVVSLSINKRISLFDFGITTSWSSLNNKNQYQLGGLFTWYPKGNLNLYTITSIVSAWEDEDNRIIFDQLVGGKVAQKLWLEGYITLGEMVNFNEKNAFVVHNSGDKTKFRTGFNFIILLSDKIELSFRYIYLQEEGYRSTSLFGFGEDPNITTINYQNNTILGGLKWTL